MDALDAIQDSMEAERQSAIRAAASALPASPAVPPRARDCDACGAPIAAPRLRALPGARLCIDCQRDAEEGR